MMGRIQRVQRYYLGLGWLAVLSLLFRIFGGHNNDVVGGVVAAFEQTVLEEISSHHLPSIHANTDKTAVGELRLMTMLLNIPIKFFRENRVEVTLWPFVNASTKNVLSGKYFVLPVFEKGVHYTSVVDRNVITVLTETILKRNENDERLRLVLRFTKYPVNSTNANPLPSPYCKIASYCTDILQRGTKDFDWTQRKFFLDPEKISSYGPPAHYLVDHANRSFADAVQDKSKLNEALLSHPGLSGTQFRHFMNNLASVTGVRYLELGVYMGSTLFSTLYQNRIDAVAIDLWNDTSLDCNSTTMDFVLAHLDAYRGNNNVDVISGDCWEISSGQHQRIVSSLGGKANIYFYDAGHRAMDHFMSLTNYLSVLEDVFLFIVDDWNMASVRDGTWLALTSLGLDILYGYEIISSGLPNTTEVGQSQWYDGMAMFVLGKGSPTASLVDIDTTGMAGPTKLPSSFVNEYESMTLHSLPQMSAFSVRHTEAAVVMVSLFNIPIQLIDDKRVELTMWQVHDTETSLVYADSTAILPVDRNCSGCKFRSLRKHEANLVAIYVLPQVATDMKVRIVLSFKKSSSSHEPPAPHCSFPSYCRDIVLYAARPIDWLDVNIEIDQQEIDQFSPGDRKIVRVVNESLTLAFQNVSLLSDELSRREDANSGFQLRHFMNNLGMLGNDVRYLHVGGVENGTTVLSMVCGNSVRGLILDSSNRSSESSLLSHVSIERLIAECSDGEFPVVILENADIFGIADAASLGFTDNKGNRQGANVLYAHFGTQDRLEADLFELIMYYSGFLDNVFTLILENWNIKTAREGVFAAIHSLDMTILYKSEIFAAFHYAPYTSWSNGVAIFVLAKAVP
jgi:hypothetical protein